MNTPPDLNLDYVANLARLALTEGEKRDYARQLGEILHYVEKLQQVDVAGVEPHGARLPGFQCLGGQHPSAKPARRGGAAQRAGAAA